MPQLTPVRFLISNGQTISNSQNVSDFEIVGFQMPSAWTAATFTFRGAPYFGTGAGGNSALQTVVDSAGSAPTVTAAAAQYVVCTPALLTALYGIATLQLVSSVAQGADREIIALGVRRDV